MDSLIAFVANWGAFNFFYLDLGYATCGFPAD